MVDLKPRIVDEAKRIEEDSVYSAKGHFEAARKWRRVHRCLGLPAVVLAALSGVSALTQFEGHEIITAFMAILVTALTAVITFLNPNEKACSHQDAGNRYNALKNSVRIFREIDIENTGSIDDLTKELKKFSKVRNELNQNTLQIPRDAFERAKRGIERGEVDYKVDQNTT
jgi:hypothetical protein